MLSQLIKALLLVLCVAILGCEPRKPPAAAAAPCDCASPDRAPHRASGRTQILR